MKSIYRFLAVASILGVSTAIAVVAHSHTNGLKETKAETSADWNQEYTGSYEGTYYNNVTETSGMALKNKLHTIISAGYVSVGYDGLFSVYPDSDARPDDGTLFDNYADIHFPCDKKRCGNYSAVGDCWNREHSIPKSWWGGAKNAMYSDAHHLLPTDGFVNNWRSNYALGEVTTPKSGKVYSFQNDISGVSKLGTNSKSQTVFEPADCFKGDMARIYFYFATKWEDAATGGDGSKMFSSSTTNCHLTEDAKEMFLRWHRADPVSIKEVKRNEGVFKHQKNRNPFVDHPEYVEAIWGDTPISPNNVKLSATTLTMSVDGEGATINAKSSDNSQISWKSNNTSICTVSSSTAASGANITVSPVAAGTTTVTASATIDGKVVSASCAVTVTKKMSQLYVEGTPTKTSYYDGDKFNHNGLTVYAVYTDSSVEDVTGLVEWTPNPLTAGTTQVTGTYSGYHVTINGITVQPKQVTDVRITGSDFSTYSSSEKTLTKNDVDFKYSNIMKSTNSGTSGAIQMKNGQGYIYNKDSLNLATITLTNVKTGSVTVYADDTASGESHTITGTSGVYDLTGYNFFKIKCNSGNVCYIDSIDVEIGNTTPSVLESIAVSNAKTEYLTGADFVKPTVTATYDNGKTKDVSSSATFTGYNMSVADTYTVNVTYTENDVTKATTYEITVADPVVVTYIEASGNPSKTVYFEGESFNSAGLTVTAHFSDGSEDIVTEEVTWTPDPLAKNTTSVTGTFEGKTTTVSGITVRAIELDSIVTTGQKTEYNVGATFSYNGQCSARFNNGSSKYVTPSIDSSNVNMNVLGTYTVVLSYTEGGITKSTSYQITVTEAPFVNTIEECYKLSAGDSAGTVYGLYVGYVISGKNADHHAMIMNGEYGIELYGKTPELTWVDGQTYLRVTNVKVDIYNDLYELVKATKSGIQCDVISSEVARNYVEPISTYNVRGTETSSQLDIANRLSLITGVVTSINGGDGWKSSSDNSDNTIVITTDDNKTISLFIKASLGTSDVQTDMETSLAGNQIIVKGFTSFYNGNFQVQFKNVVKSESTYKAKDFAQDLLDLTDSICSSSTNKESDLAGVWVILQTDNWYRLSDDEKATLINISADESGTIAQQGMARYDQICRKYASCLNFIGRTSAIRHSNTVSLNIISSNILPIIIVTSAFALITIAVSVVTLKKKKQY